MKEFEKIEQLRYVLNRFDHYLEGANSKGNFLLAFSAFLFGFVAVNFNDIVSINNEQAKTLTILLLITILVVGLLAIGLILSAVFPYLRDNNSSSKKYHSLIFFKSIAEMEEKEFVEQYKDQNEKDISKDLTKQIHAISIGLKLKFFKINWAVRLLATQLGLILFIILAKSL